MKNIRFYLEYDTPKDKQENHNNGNVIAVFSYAMNYDLTWTCYRKSSKMPNSEVHKGKIRNNFLKTKCKLINEDIARIIHPKLFEVL